MKVILKMPLSCLLNYFNSLTPEQKIEFQKEHKEEHKEEIDALKSFFKKCS